MQAPRPELPTLKMLKPDEISWHPPQTRKTVEQIVDPKIIDLEKRKLPAAELPVSKVLYSFIWPLAGLPLYCFCVELL